jgi:hypothetical protein
MIDLERELLKMHDNHINVREMAVEICLAVRICSVSRNSPTGTKPEPLAWHEIFPRRREETSGVECWE